MCIIGAARVSGPEGHERSFPANNERPTTPDVVLHRPCLLLGYGYVVGNRGVAQTKRERPSAHLARRIMVSILEVVMCGLFHCVDRGFDM